MNIQVPATLDGASSRKDGGLSVRFVTQELTPEEKTEIMQRLGGFGWMLFCEQEPDPEELELEHIRKDFGGKSPSQRLRAVLYIAYTQTAGDDSFERYYERQMEKFITYVKQNLEER